MNNHTEGKRLKVIRIITNSILGVISYLLLYLFQEHQYIWLHNIMYGNASVLMQQNYSIEWHVYLFEPKWSINYYYSHYKFPGKNVQKPRLLCIIHNKIRWP